MGEGFLFALGALGQRGRIVEAVMDDLAAAGEEGARIVRGAAHGDDVVKALVASVLDGFGAVAADVHADVGHDLDGIGIEALGYGASGEGLETVIFEGSSPAFGHLAAARVASTEEHNFHGCLSLICDYNADISALSRRRVLGLIQ